MGKAKFIADADLNEKLIAGVRRREPAIDFLSAADGGTRGLTDREVLALAAATGRVVISSDQKTMPGHFARFVEQYQSPGVIIIPQAVELARAIDELILLWTESSEEPLSNRICYVRKRRQDERRA